MSNQRVIDCYRNLFAAALIDKELHDHEQEVLEVIADRLGISKDEMGEIQKEVFEGGGSIRLPNSHRERRIMFETICEVFAADGKLVTSERDLIDRLKDHLGFQEETIPELVPEEIRPAFFELDEKLELIRLLAVGAKADGKVALDEIKLIHRAASSVGLGDDDVSRILKEVDSGTGMTIRLPKIPALRNAVIPFLNGIIQVDEDVDEREKALFNRVKQMLENPDDAE